MFLRISKALNDGNKVRTLDRLGWEARGWEKLAGEVRSTDNLMISKRLSLTGG